MANNFYIDPNMVSSSKHTGASDTLARIHRNQWLDWKERFQDRTEQLANYASTGDLTRQSIGLAENSVNRGFDSMAQNQDWQQRSIGINMTDQQRASNDRIMGLTKASTMTSAMNQARISGQDRDMQILAGGGGLASDLTNQ